MKVSRPNRVPLLYRRVHFISVLLLIMAGCATLPTNSPPPGVPDVSATLDGVALSDEFARQCPVDRAIVTIKEANPQNVEQHRAMLKLLREKLQQDNTTILLGPNVILDFTYDDLPLPLSFGRCITLQGVSGFAVETLPNTGNSPGSSTAPEPEVLAQQFTIPTLPNSPTYGGAYGTGRTPHSLGPLLKYGSNQGADERVFLEIVCPPGDSNDNVRISGFQIHGPSFGQQDIYNYGIKIYRCLNIEISNMEIAGWGGAAIVVGDDGKDENQPIDGPGQEQPKNDPGERIGRPEQIRIFHNYIHHNQFPADGVFSGDAGGYGVEVDHGAWAQIYENVFDLNRHSIVAAGDTGGYEAFRNLVLKGGGYHGTFGNKYTHSFDVHGTDCLGKSCGDAGWRFSYVANAFQFRNDHAIKIRGKPGDKVYIAENVFPHPGLEDDDGDDAVHLNTWENVEIPPGNTINYDSFGRYGVCDFDGDGVDDLFLATGQTWWFSGRGEFPWTYLSARTELLNQVHLGYFDDDERCDVLAAREGDAKWVISSGGIGPWTPIGPFSIPLNEVVFGRFDPDSPDPGAGATKRTTHVFWRRQNGDQAEWLVSPITENDWVLAGGSSFPMSDLLFGDFTGDGVTDVLAVEDGRWAISESARGSWTELNPDLSDDVSSLYIADLDNNNIDDLIKLETPQVFPSPDTTFTWWVSYDGRSKWSELRSYNILDFYEIGDVSIRVPFTFAGRFGIAPGGGVLLIDEDRFGHFYSEAEKAVDSPTDWTSRFAY